MIWHSKPIELNAFADCRDKGQVESSTYPPAATIYPAEMPWWGWYGYLNSISVSAELLIMRFALEIRVI